MNRTESRAQELATYLNERFEGQKVDWIPFSEEELSRALQGASLLVNATSIGLGGTKFRETSWLRALSKERTLVTDLNYSPRMTPLLVESRAVGLPTLDGLPMLIRQGAEAFQLWTGLAAPVQAMKAAVEEHVPG